MAKSKPGKSGSKSSARRSPSLADLDRQIVQLMNQRAEQASRLASPDGGGGLASPEREEEWLNQLVAQNPGPLSERCVRAVLREVFTGTRVLRERIRVAYLGPAYSYSHLAAIHRFGQSAELVPVGGIAAVFEEVQRGHARYGVVPLENSTDGRVADTLEMFTRLPLRIHGEVQLRIHHHLMAKCPRAEIQEVYSRPQALSQCRNWLARHLPGVRTVEVTSTSTAAQLARDKTGAAAIASIQAAVHYGLEVLAEKIEDNTDNVTRFAVIGNESAPRTGRDKTALMFEVEHRVGALADATAVIKRNRLNMTWIESFPVPDRPGAYLFFVEIEGHERDSKVRKATAALQRRALRFEILGSYERAEPLE
ncbi:MAG: prephenate dehydratase [Planctomycetia bacterium]|nr:prephenate dehydratase [Planctomycetia bacterium]